MFTIGMYITSSLFFLHMKYGHYVKMSIAGSILLLLSAGNPEMCAYLKQSTKPVLKQVQHSKEKHSCCSETPFSQPAQVSSSAQTAPVTSVDGIIYELLMNKAQNISASGEHLPYAYMSGQYRKKGTNSWQNILVYFRNPSTAYKTFEVITDGWTIEDGRTELFKHELPDGFPDTIEYNVSPLHFRLYHYCEIPCAKKKHEWLTIPEYDEKTRESIISRAQSTLKQITQFTDAPQVWKQLR